MIKPIFCVLLNVLLNNSRYLFNRMYNLSVQPSFSSKKSSDIEAVSSFLVTRHVIVPCQLPSYAHRIARHKIEHLESAEKEVTNE